MELYSGQINKLIDELAALPGIGSKSAQRLAFHLINMPKDRVDRLANVMIEARANVRYCKECYTLTDKELCPVCANPRRIIVPLWWWRTPEIWRLMRRPANMRACTMYCMVPFPRCWVWDR